MVAVGRSDADPVRGGRRPSAVGRRTDDEWCGGQSIEQVIFPLTCHCNVDYYVVPRYVYMYVYLGKPFRVYLEILDLDLLLT